MAANRIMPSFNILPMYLKYLITSLLLFLSHHFSIQYLFSHNKDLKIIYESNKDFILTKEPGGDDKH